jgi:acyl transferase domain-containing protein
VNTLADNRIDERSGHPLNEAELHEHTRARLDEFEAFADRFNYYPPNLPLICSMGGQIVPVHRSLGGSYWRRHAVSQTMPEEAARTLAEMECSEILTVGPVSPMNPDDRRCVAAMGQRLLHSLEPDQLARKSLLNAIGKLYAAGASPDFRGLHLGQQRKRISLPTYPFQKKRYWITELGDYADPSQLSFSET